MNIPVHQVDAHNIVPVWVASPKIEYGARTIRPKITKLLPKYLKEYPSIESYKQDNFNSATGGVSSHVKIDWLDLKAFVTVDEAVKSVSWAKPGEKAGLFQLHLFLTSLLASYEKKRNDPSLSCTSNLSPWLHFGHISAARAALEAKKYRQKYVV